MLKWWRASVVFMVQGGKRQRMIDFGIDESRYRG